MSKTYPSKRDASRLRRATKRAAKREVDQRGDPHQRRNITTVTRAEEPVGYQLLVLVAVNLWLNKIAAAFRPAQELSIREIQKAGDALYQVLQDIDANAKLIPDRLVTGDLHRWLVPAVVIAEFVQAAALWPVVQGLPLPLALLAAIAIATVTCLLAILTGLCVGMLACDERDGPHELSPRHRRLAGIGATVFGALVITAAIALAVARGNVLLWLPLALVVAVVEMTYGITRYEARHHRERELLRKAKKNGSQAGPGRMRCAVSDARDDDGRRSIGSGSGQAHPARGEVAFDGHWTTVHWKSPELVPSIPQVQLPGDAELAERLLVPDHAGVEEPHRPVRRRPGAHRAPLPPIRYRLPELPA